MKSAGTTIAVRTMDVLLWGAVVICVLHVWMAITGIPVPLQALGDIVWVPPTVLPQIAEFEYGRTADDPGMDVVTLLPLWLRVLGSSSIVFFTAMLVMVLRSARMLAVRVMRSDPFAPEIPDRLRFTTTAVLCLAALRLLVDLLTVWSLMNWQPAPGQFESLMINTNLPSISLSLILAAIVARVLATAFERGARLEQETDGLV